MKQMGFEIGALQNELWQVRKQRRFVMRSSEERLHELAENAWSEDSLAQLVRKYGLCDVCDFSGLNISAARVLVNCAIAALYRYPLLRSRFCYLGSQKGYVALVKKLTQCDAETMKALGLQHICGAELARSFGQGLLEFMAEPSRGTGNVLAQAVLAGGFLDGVLLDERDFSTERFREIKESLEESVRIGHFAKDCASVSAVIFHEIGHLLDSLCGVSEGAAVQEAFREGRERKIAKELSAYAATSPAEYVAEGFAECMSSGAPRRAARAVAEAIAKSYQTLEASR